MNKTKINFFTLLTLLMGIVLVSCEKEEKNAYPPIFSGFAVIHDGAEISATNIKPGDSITVVAVQEKKGKYIGSTYYKWNFSCTVVNEDGTSSTVKKDTTIHTNYDGLDNSDPIYKIGFPANAQGRASVTFKAEYNYYADGMYLSIGSGIQSSSGILSGGANGSLPFFIR